MVMTENNLPIGVRPSQAEGKNRRASESKRRRLFLLWLLTLLLLTPILVLAGYLTFAQQYQRDKALASTGEQHLRTAMNLFGTWSKRPFDVAPISQAEQEFRTTGVIMSQIQSDLPELSRLTVAIPMLSSRLIAAASLISAALGISQAGVAGCQLLEALLPELANPFSTHSQGLTMTDMARVNQFFPQLRTGVLQALDSLEPLKVDDLSFDPHLAQTFATFQHDLPRARSLLEDATLSLPALPALLGIGQPANYLLEMLDSSELRPGGGFVGSDGTVTLNGGHFGGAHVQDVLVLDNKTKSGPFFVPFPSTYNWFKAFLSDVGSWSLRDSNLDPDFPTDARNGETMYDLEGGQAITQGVVAITPAVIQHALEITGPVSMPEYNETVTAQNLVALIHYHQLGAGSEGNSNHLTSDGQTTLRKHFVELLSQHLMEKLHQLGSGELGKFVSLLLDSLRTKDIQIYLNNPMVEKILQDTHFDSGVQAPTSGDSLFLVDANVAGNKANAFITTQMQDQVSLDSVGNALHHLTLNYTWTTPGNIYSARGYYHDYLRLYVPPGSILTEAQGWQNAGSSSGYGRTIWSGDFRLDYGQTMTLNFIWRVPRAAIPNAGKADWHYQYLLQRQAGTNWASHVQLNLAACQGFSSPAGGLKLAQPEQAIWQSTLAQDTTLSTNYSCP